MELTKVRLQIAGSNYVISTTDSESYVHELAERLDKDMKDILESAPSASVTQAAVLAALDYLDELQKSTGSVDNMRRQIKNYLEDAPPPRWPPRSCAVKTPACCAASTN